MFQGDRAGGAAVMNGCCGCGFLVGEMEVRQRQIEPALSCLEAPWEDNIVKTAHAGPLIPDFPDARARNKCVFLMHYLVFRSSVSGGHNGLLLPGQ